MNVMTVTDVKADIPVKTEPKETGSQAFASELDRAANGTADSKDKAQAGQKTLMGQPETLPDETEDKKSKEAQDHKEKELLLQSAATLVSNAQKFEGMPVIQAAVQTTAQNAAQQNIVPARAGQTALEIAAQGVLPGESQVLQMPAAGTEIQTRTVDAAVVRDGAENKEGKTAQASTALNMQAPDEAARFAERAIREIGELRRAEAGVQPKKNDNPAVIPMQQMKSAVPSGENTAQTVVQPQQPDEQMADTRASGLKTTAQEQPADGQSEQGQNRTQTREPTVLYTQTPVWTASGEKLILSPQDPATRPEMPKIQQNIITTIIDKISAATGKENTEMVVQLKPEHLGGLSISLSMGESGLTAKMVTTEQSVQSLIHGQLGYLQEALREKGIPVVHMEVAYDQTSNMAGNSHAGGGQNWSAPSNAGNRVTMESLDETANYYNFMSSYEILAEHGGSVEFSA